MPTFSIQAPDGKTYKVQGPDQAGAVAFLKSQLSAPAASESKPYSGAILPFSKDAQGNVSFDPNAGLVGVLKRALVDPVPNPWVLNPETGEVSPNPAMADKASALAGLATPVNPAARAVGAAKNVKPPTARELKKVGGDLQNEIRGMGVDYKPSSVADMATAMRHELDMEGFDPDAAKAAYKVLSELSNPPANSAVPLAGLITARKRLSKAIQDAQTDSERKASVLIKNRIDEFIDAADPKTLLDRPFAGKQPRPREDLVAAQTAARKLEESNANYAAGKRSDLLARTEESAEFRAATANSGQNIGNSIRQKVKWILEPEHPERRTGFNQEEINALAAVAMGNNSRNAIRRASNILGGGGGLGAMVTTAVGGGVGALMGGAAGAAAGSVGLPAVGAGLKALENNLTRRALTQADELVRKRNPLYQRMLEEAPIEPAPALQRAALMRAALLALQEENNRRLRINVGPPGTSLR